ncbi:uncharacterized protein LOC119744898 [Patiria miniata]|uniref:Uncharacterized protein n=1 Tax=Patiria miniata TaxID=46514 RepID=A0A914BL53_PATMI|nr:uncharacterized protein LOC119744898 [Patiria miniata]
MSEQAKPNQKRVLIWAVTRSLSTVLVRALSQIPDTQVIFEYYMAAGWNTVPDALVNESSQEKSLVNMEPDVTFQSVKAMYEQDYPGKSLILGKEMPNMLGRRMDVIPHGYTHIFLIRYPAKTIPSLNKVYGFATSEMKRAHLLGPNQFEMMDELYEFVTKTRPHETAVVLDAEDLMAQPAKSLQLLCEATGLPFSQSLLHWDPIKDLPSNWSMPKSLWAYSSTVGYFKNAFESTCFRAKTGDSSSKSQEQDDQDLCRFIQDAQPYYESMYKRRLIAQ